MRNLIIFPSLLLFFTSFPFVTKSQVTIGSPISPISGALLDMKEKSMDTDGTTATKGFVYPKVNLTDRNELYPMFNDPTSSYTTNPNQKAALKASHKGLFVYNLTTIGDFREGVHFWDGKEWRFIQSMEAIETSIQGIICNAINISNNKYEVGIPFDAILKVPYTGGSGGIYTEEDILINGSTSIVINGMTFEGIPGTLNKGAGEILIHVYGTPTVSTPIETTFNISILGHTCNNIKFGGQIINNFNVRTLVGRDQKTTNGTQFDGVLVGSTETILDFGEIKVTETAAYAANLRLYGTITKTNASATQRMVMYAYFYKKSNGVETLLDATEIDIVVLKNTESFGYDDYSYSVVVGGLLEAGDEIVVKLKTGGGTWFLKEKKTGTSLTDITPIRTSMVYWKL